MIKSFADKRTAALFAGYAVKGLPHRFQRRARAKLKMLDAAKRLDDLRVPPGNRLEALKGERAGQRSMRIDERWRTRLREARLRPGAFGGRRKVCFLWRDGEPWEVEVVDDHRG